MYNVNASKKTEKLKKAYVVNASKKTEKLKKCYVVGADKKLVKLWSSGGDKLFMVAKQYLSNPIHIASAKSADEFVENGMVQQSITGGYDTWHPFCVDGKYIIYYGHSSASTKVMYSDDLTTWTFAEVSTALYLDLSASEVGVKRTNNKIFYTNGRFVAFVQLYPTSTKVYSWICLESSDGLNWTEKGTVYAGSMSPNALEYGLINGVMQYVLATNKGIFYSSDLVSWTQKDTTAYSSVYGMTADSNGEVFLLNSTTLYNLSTGNKGTASGVTTGDLFPYDDSTLLLCSQNGSKTIKKPTSTSGSLTVATLFSRGTTYLYGKASCINGVYYATMSTTQSVDSSTSSNRPSNVALEYSTDAKSWTRKILKSSGAYSYLSRMKYEENY